MCMQVALINRKKTLDPSCTLALLQTADAIMIETLFENTLYKIKIHTKDAQLINQTVGKENIFVECHTCNIPFLALMIFTLIYKSLASVNNAPVKQCLNFF